MIDVSAELRSFGALLKDIRVRIGKNQTEFAELGGVGLTSQQQYERGKTPPATDYLFRLRRHGVDIPTMLEKAGSFGDERREYDHEPVVRGVTTAREPAASDLVDIREIDMAYGLGGTYADLPVEIKVQQFSRDWLKSITSAAPSSLTWTRGRGDSMGETIRHGDLVLIDHSQNAVRDQDLIWAFTVGEIAMIKRLRIHADRVTILSDNPLVPPDSADHNDVNIVGRVVFVGRKY